MHENLGDCLKQNLSRSLQMFVPCLCVLATYYAMTLLPSYAEQRAWVVLFSNFVLCNVCLTLMLTNMCRKPFSLFQVALALNFVPLVAHFVVGVDAETEMWVTRVCTVALIAWFYIKLGLISKQYLDHHENLRFFIRDLAVKTA